MKNLFNSALFFTILFAPLSLIAQDSDGIEEVIVSATKTEANAQP